MVYCKYQGPKVKYLYILTALILILGIDLSAAEHIGIHQLEQIKHSGANKNQKKLRPHEKKNAVNSDFNLSHEVMGYHPYWVASDQYLYYDYDALAVLAYFDYELDTANGSYTTIHGWETTPLIDYAHERGVKVILTVTNFGYDKNDAFLNFPDKWDAFNKTITDLIEDRGGDGVNIDFENVRASQKAKVVAFMQKFSAYMRNRLPEAEISMATPSVDWTSAWDYKALAECCDYLMPMCYGYHWKGSENAGAVATLKGGVYNIQNTVKAYLDAGVPKEKLLIGLPWYGFDWPVETAQKNSTTTAYGDAVTYSYAERNLAQYGKKLDETSQSIWVSYQKESEWRQAWYDDSLTLSQKYQYAKDEDLAGIGIWAISYAGSGPELWNGIKDIFGEENRVETETVRKNSLIIPNPCIDYFYIDLPYSPASQKTIEIVDIKGRLVCKQTEDMFRQSIKINCREWPRGVYFVKIAAGGEFWDGEVLVE